MRPKINGKNLNLNSYQLFPKQAKETASNIMKEELLKKEVNKLAIHAYKEGVGAVVDCMKLVINKAIEAGHEGIKLTEVIQLVDKVNDAALTSLKNHSNEQPELPKSPESPA